MNYIGSKQKLLPFLLTHIKAVLQGDLSDMVFCDLFAGSGTVGKFFKTKVKQIVSNDKEYYSFVLNKNYIYNHSALKESKKCFEELQSDSKTPPIEGKIYQYYCLGKDRFLHDKKDDKDSCISSIYKRQYFSDYNGAKIDAIRAKIELWKMHGNIDDNMYYHLLASLLESADRIANTASVYGAFLKKLKKSAQKKLNIIPAYFEINTNHHLVFNEDSNELIKKIKGDILYLDPPYNTREYGANYHLLNTIALYDDFIPKGKTGLREYQKSNWCKKAKVYDELTRLIQNAHFKYIFLSYNDEGLLKLEEVKDIFSQFGEYSFKTQKYQRFKADSKREHKQDSTVEYLHILEKI